MLRARFPTGIITLASRWGSVASPVATYTGGTGGLFTLPAAITAAAGIISDHSLLRVTALLKRTGANATGQFDCQIGTAGLGSDSLIGRVQSTATDGHVARMEGGAGWSTSQTVFIPFGSAAPQGSTGGGTVVDRSTNINRGAAMSIVFGMSSANALDSYALLGYRIWIET